MPNAFCVARFFLFRDPGLSLRSNPGLKLANAFGVWSGPQRWRTPFGVWSEPQRETAQSAVHLLKFRRLERDRLVAEVFQTVLRSLKTSRY